MKRTPSTDPAGIDARLFAPATQRNRVPILDVLSQVLPGGGVVLEVASGTGEHAVWFAQHLRPLVWQPSDADPAMRESITAHARTSDVKTLKEPLDLDVTAPHWPISRADAVVCINLIHIAPWAVAEGLIAGAARVLPRGGVLYLYGPYRRDGRHTAPSNAEFDRSLRSRNREWGVRDLESVTALAEEQGFERRDVIEMPANNLSVVFARR